MDIQYILQICTFFAGIVFSLFGILIFFSTENKTIRRTLIMVCLSIAWWGFSYSMWMNATDDKAAALFWARMLSIGSTMLPLFQFHWVLALINKIKKYKKILIFYYIIVSIMELFVFHPWFVRDVAPTAGFSFWPKAGWLYVVYIIFVFFGLIGASVILLFNEYKKSKGIQRSKLRLVIIGIISGFTGGVVNFFFWFGDTIWDNYSWIIFGSFFVFTYPLIFSYSIIKFQLMDIKLVLRSSTVYLSVLLTLVVFVGFMEKILKIMNIDTEYNNYITIIIIFFFIPRIQKRYFKIANKYFFTSLYDFQEITSELSDKLTNTLNINEINEFILNLFEKSLRPKAIAIFETGNKKYEYRLIFNQSFRIKTKQKIQISKYIHKKYIEQNKPLVVEMIKNKNLEKETKILIDILNKYEIDILAPLSTKEKIVGFIALKEKESRDMYNEEDLKLLKTMGNQIALAIENATLYESIKEKNIYLEELSKMKSDFLQIISHQLNTPISIMRYALNSVEEKVIPLKKSMSFAKKALDRIGATIDAFMYAYQLEGKKVEINPDVIDIVKIINTLAKEKQQIIKTQNKDIKIKISQDIQDIPNVFCDEEKISYVISILLDNAVNYTIEGGVTISFGFNIIQKKKYLKIYFDDTGIGIGEDEKKTLFEKFVRGKKGILMHPDGSGLGLYISKKIAENNNGSLELENTEEGKGSTFSLTLPIA